MLRIGLVDHGDRFPDAEPLVQLFGGVRRRHDDAPRGDAFLAGVFDELLVQVLGLPAAADDDQRPLLNDGRLDLLRRE